MAASNFKRRIHKILRRNKNKYSSMDCTKLTHSHTLTHANTYEHTHTHSPYARKRTSMSIYDLNNARNSADKLRHVIYGEVE